jgi:hypothetical protein
MKDLEKQLKMMLLEQLMDEMDESDLRSKLSPKKEEEPMARIVEEKVVPLDEAKDELKKKFEEMKEEEASELSSEEDVDEDDQEDDYGSDLLKKIIEAKKKKKILEE